MGRAITTPRSSVSGPWSAGIAERLVRVVPAGSAARRRRRRGAKRDAAEQRAGGPSSPASGGQGPPHPATRPTAELPKRPAKPAGRKLVAEFAPPAGYVVVQLGAD